MTTAIELEGLMEQSHIRMAGRKQQAEIIASQLDLGERPLDVVKAYRVLVDGRKLGKNPGFSLVFLTDKRLIVASAGDTFLPLGEIATITDLVKGKFQWTTKSGQKWSFEHTRGIIRSNGNKENTERFYSAMKSAAVAHLEGS